LLALLPQNVTVCPGEKFITGYRTAHIHDKVRFLGVLTIFYKILKAGDFIIKFFLRVRCGYLLWKISLKNLSVRNFSINFWK
jgi:hypothetical protein